MKKEKDFEAWSMHSVDPNKIRYAHWSDGLKVYIRKGDVEIVLNGKEMQGVINALPRTHGGVY